MFIQQLALLDWLTEPVNFIINFFKTIYSFIDNIFSNISALFTVMLNTVSQFALIIQNLPIWLLYFASASFGLMVTFVVIGGFIGNGK